MNANQTIRNLPRTRSLTINKLIKLGVDTFQDLLNYYPSRYNDYSLISPVAQLRIEQLATIKVQVVSAKTHLTRSGKRMQQFEVEDASGKITAVAFNQPYLLRIFKPGSLLSISGVCQLIGTGKVFTVQDYEVLNTLEQPTTHTGRLVPVYSETSGLSSKTIREKIKYVLSEIIVSESLPKEIMMYNRLINCTSAYQQIHFPDNFERLHQAQQRLAFEELFMLQLSSALLKKQRQSNVVDQPIILNQKHVNLLKDFINNLPFKLTSAQQQAWEIIKSDLSKKQPMNRLLQGDVGSGKTVVAALAAYLLFLNNQKTAIMAPTEILAQQHFATIKDLFKGCIKTPKIILQTGSLKQLKPKIKYDIIIGTQALLTEKLNLKNFGGVVIDEQHRFGVKQRAMLSDKTKNPHLLTMTATPIPRTIALTLFSDLDISIINEMPFGRIPIKSYLVPLSKRQAGYEWITKQISEKKAQVFVICPLVEESQVETNISIKAAEKEYILLQKVFPKFKVSLIHGKKSSKEKQTTMTDFVNRKIDILVSTSLVEVGVDAPGATIMIIEGAERFGLAQLHQLRGRIGRNSVQSYCFLYTENTDQKIQERLSYFVKNTNGLALAEYDLKNRGTGELFGQKQHGQSGLKIASLFDLNMIETTKKAVEYFINQSLQINQFPEMKKQIDKIQSGFVSQRD